MISVTRLGGEPATYTYHPTLLTLATVTGPLNRTTTYGHDAAGNVTSITDPLQHTTTFAYNSKGQRTSVTDPLQHTTTYTYEGGDLKAVTEPTNAVSTRFTDSVGRVVAVTNALGETTRYTYDANDRKRTVTNALGHITRFEYFPDGQLESVTNANQQTTRYSYDSMGRLASTTDPLQRTERFEYDLAGNVVVVADRKGQVTTRAYDELNRLATITYADGTSLVYIYDERSRVEQVTDTAAGPIRRTYDDLDRVRSETTPQGTVAYTYDDAGRLRRMGVSGQSEIEYTYDDADRLTRISQGASNVTFDYDAADRRTALTLPNGVTTTYAYDDADYVIAMTYRLDSVEVGSLTYAYDLAGRRTSTGGSWARTGLPPAIASATYDAANQLTSWAGEPRQYDGNGSLVSDGFDAYEWDSRGRLAAISGQTSASFAYDAVGRRIRLTFNGSSTEYLYDGTSVVSQSEAVGTAAFLNGPAVDEWLTRTDGSGMASFVADGLGSRIATFDIDGVIVGQDTYEAFGSTRSVGLSERHGRFSGREEDLSGLYYYRARYYDPKVGRFISEDSAGGDAFGNRYTYVENDPANAIDPSGLTKVDVCCRGLQRRILRIRLIRLFKHCFIVITADGASTGDTYAVLGDRGSTRNQIPRKNDDGGPDRNWEDNPRCKPAAGNECQIQKLKNGLEAAVRSGTCPSCGADNYDAYRFVDLLHPIDGFNSNTWVYNMILGAGMSPPGMGHRTPGYHQAPGAWYPQ